MLKETKLIPEGRWRESMGEFPVATSSLTPQQIEYIQKLGHSKGRDVAPRDKELYRELLNKEIIVDKGRCMALSKFGKEVFRFLS